MRIVAGLAVIAVLLIAGCADTGSTSQNHRTGGFYGGVTGGGSP